MSDLEKQVGLEPNVTSPVKFGFIVLGIFVSIFIFWSVLFPLESGAIAEGKITVDTNRKSIQHLEGGIVKKIFIKEGQIIKKGQALIELSTTQAQATQNLLRGQSDALRAAEARLISEQDNDKTVKFPKILLERASDPKLMKIMRGQQDIFKARLEAHKTTKAILDQRVKQLKDEIKSLQSQVKSSESQLKLIYQELKAVNYLAQRKLIELPRLLALKRNAARLKGERDEDLALIARSQQKIGETLIQKINYDNTTRKEVLENLRETQKELASILEREKASEDILKRTLIIAPRAGRIVDLKVHTIGGIITPRETIMDIVPTLDALVIEARISPLDIDVVYNGLKAKVQLLAYKQRHAPTLNGVVTHVSADTFTDKATGTSYYLARIKIDPKELKQLKNIKLHPGMPAQVMIVSDKRTAMGYLISPLFESFNRAFREK